MPLQSQWTCLQKCWFSMKYLSFYHYFNGIRSAVEKRRFPIEISVLRKTAIFQQKILNQLYSCIFNHHGPGLDVNNWPKKDRFLNRILVPITGSFQTLLLLSPKYTKYYEIKVCTLVWLNNIILTGHCQIVSYCLLKKIMGKKPSSIRPVCTQLFWCKTVKSTVAFYTLQCNWEDVFHGIWFGTYRIFSRLHKTVNEIACIFMDTMTYRRIATEVTKAHLFQPYATFGIQFKLSSELFQALTASHKSWVIFS